MTVPGPAPDQKTLASRDENGADWGHPGLYDDPRVDGGWTLTAPNASRNVRKWLGPGLAVCLLGLLYWQLDATSEPEMAVIQNGQGGPAESVGIEALAHLGSFQPLLTQSELPSEQRGPVFRPDEGEVEMRIGRGQTFYEALDARGVAHEDIMTLVEACRSFRDLTKVRQGELFRIHIAPDGGLRSLGFDLDEESFVTWVRQGDTYARQDGTYPVEYRVKGVSGTIEASLYASLQQLDAPLALASKMNDILGWDLDFSRDLRKGDTFRIVYEEVWKDQELVRTGSILALEIVNRGQDKRAFLYTNDEGRPGYYDPEGKNLQKQLMRAPLNYSRISSTFSYRRFHPVLKKWMPHLGVDYAAPLGTPVRAAGDGVIAEASSKQGNGRYVHIRHTNREYETYYLHLSKFAPGVKVGQKVRQGQVIGYVGATGYATGPHLDFRVKRSGKFVDPRKLKLPAAAPVPDGQLARYAAQTGLYAAALDELDLDRGPVNLPPLALLEPPAWDRIEYAATELPATVRADD